MKIAVIPARGGSKRIPRKNIKMFGGRPMIAWSIEAALNSGSFDQVLVSTDDMEIAEVARDHGAQVPFMRPLELADDYTGTIPVVRHAVQWICDNVGSVDKACCIYATAPFIDGNDIRKGLDSLQQGATDYAFSVTRYAFPIQRALKLTGNGRVQMFEPQYFHTRSQDLDEAYHDAGQFYWGTARAWLDSRPIFTPNAAAVILPSYRVQDIDTPEDWVRAELMHNMLLASRPDS
ncbi:pseudaminic acid cytidylyltransferase [Pseudomonas sp. nanlin1]|uniref:pseudaminic acid cytidylyltransferase n=1 Tax=Pseudomonas sp. nanlin1 TaxID=3040605 RepID=UPI00388D68C2